MRISLLIFFNFSLLATLSGSDSSKYYFYHPEITVGSETWFNPVTLALNGSFDILRNGSRTKDITALEYALGWDNVWYNISHPIKRIEQFGWSEFLAHEVLPLRGLDKNYSQYWPNYATHIVGNGMQNVKVAEWFNWHGYHYPRLLALINTSFYQVLNEVVEHSSRPGVNIDPIADILIFNPLGFLLFSFDGPRHFFSRTAVISDWSLQPLLLPVNTELENAGQQYSLKYPLPKLENVKGFMFWGIQGMTGLSFVRAGGYSTSAALGVVANNLVEKRLGVLEFMTANLDGAFGYFRDYRNSLLYSVIVTGPQLPNCRINIYPGVLKYKLVSPGIYLGFGQWDGLVFGATLSYVPIGLGFGFN